MGKRKDLGVAKSGQRSGKNILKIHWGGSKSRKH